MSIAKRLREKHDHGEYISVAELEALEAIKKMQESLDYPNLSLKKKR